MTREEHIIYAENLRVALNMTNTFSAETMESLDAAIKALKQKPCVDAISRKAAIRVANRADYRGLTVEDVKKVTDVVVEELKKLPNVQPD